MAHMNRQFIYHDLGKVDNWEEQWSWTDKSNVEPFP